MSSTYYAQPYNIGATGFYFDSYEDYQGQAAALRDDCGSPVEEFEIQYINGDDGQLFRACDVQQGSLEQWFNDIENLDDNEKAALFYLCDDVGYGIQDALEKLEDVTLYEGPLKDAAGELFDDCYLSDVPALVQQYIDYDAFARDCQQAGDMAEFDFNGTTYTCTNASGL